MLDWRQQARCKGLPPDPFFATDDDALGAVEVCASCPVRLTCLWAAMLEERTGELRYGIRGAALPGDRYELRQAGLADELAGALLALSLEDDPEPADAAALLVLECDSCRAAYIPTVIRQGATKAGRQRRCSESCTRREARETTKAGRRSQPDHRGEAVPA